MSDIFILDKCDKLFNNYILSALFNWETSTLLMGTFQQTEESTYGEIYLFTWYYTSAGVYQ